MGEKICILPCNGLDKSLGVIARQLALEIIKKNPTIELICPVLLNTGDQIYENLLKESKIYVIDGCMTRCATKLIDKKGLQIKNRIFVPDITKKYNIKPGKELQLEDETFKRIEGIASDIIESSKESEGLEIPQALKSEEIEYFKVKMDKFKFRVPKQGYFFNENDCWIKLQGNKGLLGITDYLQTKAGDIMLVEFPELGLELEQFDEAGTFESTKTVLPLISPCSGKITALNKVLENAPELINQDPYGKGWFVELELKNFEEEKELLLNGSAYFELMKKKLEKDQKERERGDEK
ncbi:MAG TPA: putative zinc-binding protein [Candidatus Deferrimicrobium sp.]|nr:putative zinc-binding protein [Candidatus Deferrimicrobium sp.]